MQGASSHVKYFARFFIKMMIMITGTLPYHDRKYTSIFYAWQEADVMTDLAHRTLLKADENRADR